jgi:hypothetical protein
MPSFSKSVVLRVFRHEIHGLFQLTEDISVEDNAEQIPHTMGGIAVSVIA